MDKSEFTRLFILNTQRLREERGVTQETMAAGLGVTLNAYKTYETRTLLPHRYIQAFALMCGVALEDVFKIHARPENRQAKTAIRVRAANNKHSKNP